MKVLGIDYGSKRIGVAISDEAGEFAFPKTVLLTEAEPIEKIATLCKEEHVEVIVIGESVAQSGMPNAISGQAAKFKEKLAAVTNLPIFLEREDFSSVEAHRYQTKAGNKDDSAAAIILQRFLDKKKLKG